MAELAFETVARVILVVIILSLLVGLLYSLYGKAKGAVELEGLQKVDMANLPKEALKDVVEQCRESRALNKDCAILLNLDSEDREYLESLGVEVQQEGSTGLLSLSDGALVLK